MSESETAAAHPPKQKPKKILVLWNDPGVEDEADTADSPAAELESPSPTEPGSTEPTDSELSDIGANDAPSSLSATPERVADALRRAGYRVAIEDLDSDADRVGHAVVVHRPDLIFNMVDNFCDALLEHAAIAGMYELYGYPFTGGDQLALASCLERARTHLQLSDSGVPVPQFVIVRDLNAIPPTDELEMPVIVTNGFDDNYRAEGRETPLWSREEIEAQLQAVAADYEMPFLVEEFIDDRHVHAIVLGNRVLEVLPLVERVRSDDGESYLEVARLDIDQADDIRQLARRSFRATDCRDCAQVDFAIDSEGEAHVVDVRPMFDFGLESVFGVAAEYSELGYDGSVARIAHHAFVRLSPPELAPKPADDAEESL